jgi:hypothetical protein
MKECSTCADLTPKGACWYTDCIPPCFGVDPEYTNPPGLEVDDDEDCGTPSKP